MLGHLFASAALAASKSWIGGPLQHISKQARCCASIYRGEGAIAARCLARDGVTQTALSTHGCSMSLMAGLLNCGLVTIGLVRVALEGLLIGICD
jgi:hypothetical protein